MTSNPPPGLTSPPWSERTKRTVVLIVLALGFFLVLQLTQVVSMVVIAIVISYLMQPLVGFFDRKLLSNLIENEGIRRSLAVILTVMVVIVMLTTFVFLIVPPIAFQMQQFIDELPDLVDSVEKETETILKRPIVLGEQKLVLWDEIVGSEDHLSPLENLDLAGTVQQAATTLSAPVVSVASLLFSVIFNTLFVLVMIFYLMKDGPRFVQTLDNLVPIEYQGDVQRLIYELGVIWNAYLRGQLFLGLVIGVMTGLAAAILGLPQPLVLGLLAGLLEFIPNVGPILASLPAILFALISPSATIPGLDGVPFAIIVALVYAAIQQIEALILVPRVIGGNLDLHPFVIIVAVISGASIAGILGVLLAAPIVATARLFLVYIRGKLLDTDPFTGIVDGELYVESIDSGTDNRLLPSPASISEPSEKNTGGELTMG